MTVNIKAILPDTAEWAALVVEVKNSESVTQWVRGDAALAVFPIGTGHGGDRSKSGPAHSCEANLDRFAAETGVSLSVLKECRLVAAAWSPESRVEGASFAAHKALMAPDKQAMLKPGMSREAARVAAGQKPGAHAEAVIAEAEKIVAKTMKGELTKARNEGAAEALRKAKQEAYAKEIAEKNKLAQERAALIAANKAKADKERRAEEARIQAERDAAAKTARTEREKTEAQRRLEQANRLAEAARLEKLSSKYRTAQVKEHLVQTQLWIGHALEVATSEGEPIKVSVLAQIEAAQHQLALLKDAIEAANAS